MKRIKQSALGLIMLLLTSTATPTMAQTQDLQQLILDIEKLTQLKSILTDMKTGYSMISSGYNEVKNIAHGNFSLHEAFLDGLLAVSPQVRNYGRVADIILEHGTIVSEYKSAYKRFRQSGTFNPEEINYLGNVYSRLIDQSAQNLDELAMILTAGKLRMSDDERLKAIDRLYADTDDKLQFLRHFNRETTILAIQRQKELNDVNTTQKLY